MSYTSNKLTAAVIEDVRKKSKEEEKKLKKGYDLNHFEVRGLNLTPLAVICIIVFGVIMTIGAISNRGDAGEMLGFIAFFVVVALLFGFMGWASAHQRLIVNGNDATYVNIWGAKREFKFSDVTAVLTTEQFMRLYVGNKKVATLDKDMHCLDLLMERCEKENIPWQPMDNSCISKLSLTWNSVRTIAWIFIWTFVGISVILIITQITSMHLDFLEFLEYELLMAGFFAAFVVIMMLAFGVQLKEVRAIEKELGVNFNSEMKLRGAIGREYHDNEWFVEAIPGRIEVLNRRFIKEWHGIKSESTNGTTMYHVEFTDINGKKRKVGGHYEEYAEAMEKWYKGGR